MAEHIETEDDAIRFVRRVKFALRYNSTQALPLASMYGAARDQRTAIELTNALLARDEVIETNVIADRLVLVHRDIVPALFALRIRFRVGKLSEDAEKAFQLIRQDGTASAGDVRRFLGVGGAQRPDPADVALDVCNVNYSSIEARPVCPRTEFPTLVKRAFPTVSSRKHTRNW